MGYARIGDSWSGVCNCHESPISVTGEIETGSDNVFINGRGVAREGDIVRASCGHTGTINSGSDYYIVNGKRAARLNDTTTGCCVGHITSSSEDVSPA